MADETLRFQIVGDSSSAEDAFDRTAQAAEETEGRFKAWSVAAGAAGLAAGGLLAKGFADALDIQEANTKLAAQLGLTGEDAAQAGRVAAAAYADNWGENIGEGSEEWATKTTEQVLAVSGTFEQEFGKTTAAVGQLLNTELVGSSQEAMDLITAGLQGPANKADDLLDTFNEYSTQFRRVGLDGQQALGLISQAMQAGARDSDQVADAIGQFGERALAGGKPVEDAFKSIGLNAQTMAKMIGQGGPAAQQALGKTLEALRGTTNEQVKLNAAAALFGDPGNVMGASLFAMNMDTAAASVGNVSGKTDQLMTTLGSSGKAQIDGLKRSFDGWLQSVVGGTGATSTFAAGLVAFGPGVAGMVTSLASIATGLVAVSTTSVGARIATMASAAATGVSTAAQWAWNAALSANPIGLVVVAIAALVAGLVWFFTQTKLGQQIFGTAMDATKTAFGWVWDKLTAGFTWVKSNWPLLLVILTGPFGLAVLAIIKHWDAIKAGFTAAKAWIVNLAKSLWTPLQTAGRAAFNAIASLWNNTVGRISFTVPSWIPVVGGNSFSVPKIPLMAAGGIVTSPTLAMIGEEGPEAVVPLSGSNAPGLGGPPVEIHLHGILPDQYAVARAVTDGIRVAVDRGLLPRSVVRV